MATQFFINIDVWTINAETSQRFNLTEILSKRSPSGLPISSPAMRQRSDNRGKVNCWSLPDPKKSLSQESDVPPLRGLDTLSCCSLNWSRSPGLERYCMQLIMIIVLFNKYVCSNFTLFTFLRPAQQNKQFSAIPDYSIQDKLPWADAEIGSWRWQLLLLLVSRQSGWRRIGRIHRINWISTGRVSVVG